jgi:hypothetical protein
MRVTLWLPIAVMGCAALSVLLVRRRKTAARTAAEPDVPASAQQA